MTESVPREFHRSTVESWAKRHGISPEDVIAFVEQEGDRIIEESI